MGGEGEECVRVGREHVEEGGQGEGRELRV